MIIRTREVVEAQEIAGSLSKTEKLPGYSYGLDAETCQLGSQRIDDPLSICHRDNCYARAGAYVAPWVKAAQKKRHSWLKFSPWIGAMAVLIHANCCPRGCRDHSSPRHYFRWHDSGDLQGVWHLANIAEVCRQTPTIRHWLPTKEQDHVADFIKTGGVVPANLNIVIGEHAIDELPVITRPELVDFPTSTVQSWPSGTKGLERRRLMDGKGNIECLAEGKRSGTCGSCRACWDPRVTNVSYQWH